MADLTAGLASVAAVSDASGAVVNTYSCDPFGDTLTTFSTGQLSVNALTRFSAGTDYVTRGGSTAWATGGGGFEAAAADARTAGASNGWVSWYPTALVQRWIAGTLPSNGLVVKQRDENVANVLSFDAGEGTNVPQLQVVYEGRIGELPQYTFLRQQLSDRMDLAVNLGNGNVIVHQVDLVLAGTAGHDLVLERWHNGRHNRVWFFGRGWEQTATATVHAEYGDGSVYLFMPSGYNAVFEPDGQGGYVTPPGVNAKLVKNGDGTWRLTFNRSGTKLHFTGRGGLSAMEDRNGNGVSFAWDGRYPTSAADTKSRQTTFTRQAHQNGDRITQITDASGRTLGYSYSASGDELRTYTDANGGVTSFEYDQDLWSQTRISRITDPRGNVTELTYESAWLGRVTSIKRITDPATGTGPTWRFSYATSDATCPAGTFSVTYVDDPLNHRTTWNPYIYVGQQPTNLIDPTGALFHGSVSRFFDEHRRAISCTLLVASAVAWPAAIAGRVYEAHQLFRAGGTIRELAFGGSRVVRGFEAGAVATTVLGVATGGCL